MRLSISPRQLPVVGAGIGVCASLGYVLRRKRIKASQWERTNFHGATVSLRGGVAMAGAAVGRGAGVCLARRLVVRPHCCRWR